MSYLQEPTSTVQERSWALQTVSAHFISCNLHGMTFVQGVKSLPVPASRAHLLDCWGISLGQLFGDPDLTCNILKLKGQMDLV
ncbi:hypothetical protein TNCV_3300481 [Trichonephila clavipes]|nr:hypothetical protein TNCV_3300481 [Trichonephila clavipes]